jgi:5-methylcytosine-specific restriction endonuclease McrA
VNETAPYEATYESYGAWLNTVTARESANTGDFSQALYRTMLLRRNNRTLAEYDAAIAMLQEQRDAAAYYGDVDSTPQERFEALVRVVSTYGDDWNSFDSEGTYQDFLESPYWKTIAAYVKWLRGGRCQMCDTDKGLQAHHKSYKHKGQEHKHLEDLVVICGDCHTKHHGKRAASG